METANYRRIVFTENYAGFTKKFELKIDVYTREMEVFYQNRSEGFTINNIILTKDELSDIISMISYDKVGSYRNGAGLPKIGNYSDAYSEADAELRIIDKYGSVFEVKRPGLSYHPDVIVRFAEYMFETYTLENREAKENSADSDFGSAEDTAEIIAVTDEDDVTEAAEAETERKNAADKTPVSEAAAEDEKTHGSAESRHTYKFTCADCGTKACQFSDFSRMPSDAVCLTKKEDQEDFRALYTPEDLRIAHNAAATEAAGYCRQTRLEETMAFAYRMGYKKIGIGFCVGLSKEAATLAGILRENGFEVEAAACKCGSIPKEFIGIEREGYVDSSREFEIMCNPAGQADYLSRQGCDLCVILGLCVGHDTLFIKHCQVPVTVLSSKDRVLGHNPMAALYTSDSYLKRVHTFIEDNFESLV